MNTNCAIDLVSPERLQRIRELAEKATPTAWEADVIADIINERSGRELDAAYISAVHPGVVLAMCEEIELLRKSAARFNKEADWLAEHMPKTSVIDGRAKVQCLRGMKEWRETARNAVEEKHNE